MVSIRIIIDRFRAMSRTERNERTLSFGGDRARILRNGLRRKNLRQTSYLMKRAGEALDQVRHDSTEGAHLPSVR